MIFEIKTKEIILPNGESDGYETIKYDVSDDIIKEWLLDIIEKHYREGVRKFTEKIEILDDEDYFFDFVDYFEDELDEKAQDYYNKEVK